MDDFLYIILGIAWVIWSLYSNKQKLDKKRAEQAQREEQARQTRQANREYYPESTTTSYEPVNPPVTRTNQENGERSVLEEIFGEYLPHQEAEQETYIPEVSETTWDSKMTAPEHIEAESLEEIKEEVPADYFTRQYKSGYQPIIQNIKPEKAVDQDDDKLEEIVEEFDFKRAVIYSEILRAPYISER